MRIDVSTEDTRFRMEVREWLNANAPRAPRPPGGAEMRDFDVAWRRRQYEGGYPHISWPTAYGGLGLSVSRQLIWCEEYARAGAPPGSDLFFVALSHAGPTLIAQGDEHQKSVHLPKILKGDAVWCQGFSEPSSGSDLASLRARGVIDGDWLVVTGQKIWTGHAHLSDYQELLVRTDPDAPKYKGITWVIADMRSPGIDVRPIRNMAGEDHFCEVFYDEVRIPLSNVVGGLNNGWKVAMATLGIERGAASIPHILEIYNRVEDLIELAGSTPGRDGRPALSDEAVASELAQLRADTAALRAMAYMVISRGERSMGVGPDGSIVRLQFSLLVQRLYKAAMDILGPASLEHSPLGGWSHEYLVNFKQTIAGGTSEIQRNIIGERLLGLPRGR